MNFLLLILSAARRGYKSKYWGTLQEFATAGTSLNPLEKLGTEIFSGNKMILVYNLEQADNDLNLTPFPVPHVNYDRAEELVNATRVRIKYNTDPQIRESYYHYPPEDYIEIPTKTMFEQGLPGLAGYYETAFHELTHWCEIPLGFRNYPDELRELVAEIASALVTLQLKIPPTHGRSNINKYVDQWIDLLEADHNLIFLICDLADKVMDRLLSYLPKERKI